jgi:hypothetical protein
VKLFWACELIVRDWKAESDLLVGAAVGHVQLCQRMMSHIIATVMLRSHLKGNPFCIHSIEFQL